MSSNNYTPVQCIYILYNTGLVEISVQRSWLQICETLSSSQVSNSLRQKWQSQSLLAWKVGMESSCLDLGMHYYYYFLTQNRTPHKYGLASFLHKPAEESLVKLLVIVASGISVCIVLYLSLNCPLLAGKLLISASFFLMLPTVARFSNSILTCNCEQILTFSFRQSIQNGYIVWSLKWHKCMHFFL